MAQDMGTGRWWILNHHNKRREICWGRVRRYDRCVKKAAGGQGRAVVYLIQKQVLKKGRQINTVIEQYLHVPPAKKVCTHGQDG